jgi:hypothetical protein
MESYTWFVLIWRGKGFPDVSLRSVSTKIQITKEGFG